MKVAVESLIRLSPHWTTDRELLSSSQLCNHCVVTQARDVGTRRESQVSSPVMGETSLLPSCARDVGSYPSRETTESWVSERPTPSWVWTLHNQNICFLVAAALSFSGEFETLSRRSCVRTESGNLQWRLNWVSTLVELKSQSVNHTHKSHPFGGLCASCLDLLTLIKLRCQSVNHTLATPRSAR